MKVICIKTNKGWKFKTQFHPPLPPSPEFGETVTVVESKVNMGIPVYILTEYPYGGGYAQRAFIPISTIDEKEFEREYNKEKV